MNANTPLSRIKTPDQLLFLLVSQGWSKSPTKEPVSVCPDGALVFRGWCAPAPCWETSCEQLSLRRGEERITLRPGMGEDHEEVFVDVAVRDGLLTDWPMCEIYAGTWEALDPETVCLSDLKARLRSWFSY